MLPKVYGDKTEVAVTGADRGPVQSVSTTVTIPANDPIEAARVYQKLMSEGRRRFHRKKQSASIATLLIFWKSIVSKVDPS